MRLATLAATAALLALAAPGCRAGADPAADGGSGGGGEGAAAWGRALAAHAEDGGLDYAALKRDRGDLDRFLRSLRAARPGQMSDAEALAFWINAYNAVVAHHVLERYPGIRSVQDVDGFFSQLTYPVAGEELTLDAIEEHARDFGDPRVHFAVVCASTSCPDLRGEPYTADELDAQLEEQTRRFLSDEAKGLRYDEKENTAWLSSIFKWYAGDFTGGSTVVAFFARGGVLEWVRKHAPNEIATKLKSDPSVKYLDYDWSLNDR
jgi:hypothetical protein